MGARGYPPPPPRGNLSPGKRIGDGRERERLDIREEKEEGNGREGCGSTHRDRLNSRAARLFFRPAESSLSPPRAPDATSLLQRAFARSLLWWLSYLVPLYVALLLSTSPAPPSTLCQPAYRQSSFSILRGAASPPPSPLSPSGFSSSVSLSLPRARARPPSLLFERYAWPRKKLGNIISETEGTRLPAVPVRAAAVSLVVSASRFDAQTTASSSVNERVQDRPRCGERVKNPH